MSTLNGSALPDRERSGAVKNCYLTNEITITRLGVDGGNRQVKTSWGRSVEVMPSVIYHPIAIDYINPSSDKTHVVNYHGGQCSELSGQTWVLGKSAHSFNGSHTFLGEKSSDMHKLALACLPAIGDDMISPASLRIEELRLCLPDAHNRNKVQALKDKLAGKHHLTIDEQEIRVTIKRVTVTPEGIDAYRWLMAQEFYQYLGVNGVLDIGGGNTTGQLFSEADDPIGGSRCVAPGVVALARAIAKDPVLFEVEAKGCSPKLETILDAIANGSFVYGTTGVSFANIFPQYLNVWIQEIYRVLKTSWDPYFGNLGEVAIIGGGADHGQWFVERTKGRFKIASDPTICTMRGMLI